jgi:hypothetical protein
VHELTRAQIARLPAGPELDRLVAERVMGWTLAPDKSSSGKVMPWNAWYAEDGTRICAEEGVYDLHYSRDMSLAWEVVKRMWNAGHDFEISGRTGSAWADFGGLGSFGTFTDIPLLICRAALALLADGFSLSAAPRGQEGP